MEQNEQLLEAIFGTMRSRQGIHCHVTTSPRRDVGSTMQKSTTSPRRDVSSKICISSLNARRLEKLGHRETYDQRHGFPEPEDPDFERLPGIRTASILLDIIEDIMMMFLILNILLFSFMMF